MDEWLQHAGTLGHSGLSQEQVKVVYLTITTGPGGSLSSMESSSAAPVPMTDHPCLLQGCGVAGCPCHMLGSTPNCFHWSSPGVFGCEPGWSSAPPEPDGNALGVAGQCRGAGWTQVTGTKMGLSQDAAMNCSPK